MLQATYKFTDYRLPITGYRGNIIISERRRLLTRRSYDISTGENRFYYEVI